jgi:hypothetical protein
MKSAGGFQFGESPLSPDVSSKGMNKHIKNLDAKRLKEAIKCNEI